MLLGKKVSVKPWPPRVRALGGGPAMASRVPGSAMASRVPGSAMAARAPRSAMAARAPRSAVGSRTGAALEASCPVYMSLEASRAPTPPSRWMVYGAGRTVREGGGGVVSDFVSLCFGALIWFSCPSFAN